MVGDCNQKAYARTRIVQHYAQLGALQPAEKTILALLRDRLPSMSMLDIGVGGGRTTKHFAAIVADYVGIDYSAAMIAACKQRFAASSQTAFELGDARNLSQFADDSFDFILFSFNGLDSLSHLDRLKVLQEVSRVGKAGGYFCFSSHNLRGLEHAFAVKTQLSLNPFKTYVNLVMLALLRWTNRPMTLPQLKASAYVVAKDESHNFCLQTYYVRPEQQLSQLDANFSHVTVYSWKSGLNLTNTCELLSNKDLWLYYLCRIDGRVERV